MRWKLIKVKMIFNFNSELNMMYCKGSPFFIMKSFFVPFCIVFSSKFLITIGTIIRFFSCVNKFMPFCIVFSSEFFMTEAAFEFLITDAPFLSFRQHFFTVLIELLYKMRAIQIKTFSFLLESLVYGI